MATSTAVSISLIASALVWNACGSRGGPNLPPADDVSKSLTDVALPKTAPPAPLQVTAPLNPAKTLAAEPDPLLDPAFPPLPWLLVAYEADLGPLPQGLALGSGPPERLEQPGPDQLSKPVLPDSLSPAFKRGIGTKLWVHDNRGSKLCEVLITGYAARAVLDPFDSKWTMYFMPFSETVDEQGRPLPTPTDRYIKVFDEEPKRLVATFGRADGGLYSGCAGGEEGFLVSRLPLTPLEEADDHAVTETLRARALEAFRAHSFWEMQQEAYRRSLEFERMRVTKDLEEARREKADREMIDNIKESDRSAKAPKTWDQMPGNASQRTFAMGWLDAKGKLSLLKLVMGNALSCAAPEAWMMFHVRGEDLEVASFGVGRGAEGIADLDRDGRLEQLISRWVQKRIESVDSREGVTRTLTYPFGIHSCSSDSLPAAPVPESSRGKEAVKAPEAPR